VILKDDELNLGVFLLDLENETGTAKLIVGSIQSRPNLSLNGLLDCQEAVTVFDGPRLWRLHRWASLRQSGAPCHSYCIVVRVVLNANIRSHKPLQCSVETVACQFRHQFRVR
jgi:hypothetical protein